MLSNTERQYIYKKGYIPEQIIDYVISVSEAEPFLVDDFLCFIKGAHLIFVGYSLEQKDDDNRAYGLLDILIKDYKIRDVAFMASFHQPSECKCLQTESDYFYRLNLMTYKPSSSLNNSIRRAERELVIETSTSIEERHVRLIDEFLAIKRLDSASEYLFKRIPAYVSSSNTVMVFNAINKDGILVGFDIADYGLKEYCCYMFNIISRRNYVPGTSDLLLSKMIDTAKTQGKTYLNMGLGINDGNVFFKKKWGVEEFVKYYYCYYRVEYKKEPSSISKFITSLFRKNS